MINLILISFWSGFMTFIGVIVGIIVIIILGLYVCLRIYLKHSYPKMQIFRGEEIIKETYAPSRKNLLKCLEDMHDDYKIVISERSPNPSHPIRDLYDNHSCELNESTKLVGYEHLSEIYFTTDESTNKKFRVEQKLRDYLKTLTEEELQTIKEKTWWKMSYGRDSQTFYMVFKITRIKLEDPQIS